MERLQMSCIYITAIWLSMSNFPLSFWTKIIQIQKRLFAKETALVHSKTRSFYTVEDNRTNGFALKFSGFNKAESVRNYGFPVSYKPPIRKLCHIFRNLVMEAVNNE
jgi:hypothetical protein